SYSRHVNRRITGYVTVDATKKTIKKTSKFGILIFGSSLRVCPESRNHRRRSLSVDMGSPSMGVTIFLDGH
ncbi:MAG: hypothetical protein ACKVE4_05610, partial [Dissulfuribacterales bacterium]